MKLRRHSANKPTREQFEEYIDFDPYEDINVKLADYLKQKTNEIANLSTLISKDIKGYEGELNNYSPEDKKKPWWKVL